MHGDGGDDAVVATVLVGCAWESLPWFQTYQRVLQHVHVMLKIHLDHLDHMLMIVVEEREGQRERVWWSW